MREVLDLIRKKLIYQRKIEYTGEYLYITPEYRKN